MIATIDIAGADPRDRGRQYGEAVREQIASSVAFYAESVARRTGLRWLEVQDRAHAWVPILEDYAPALLPELEGIAEASGRGFGEILALNTRGELTASNPFENNDEGCTSFAVLPEANALGHTLAGQNWDLGERTAPTIVVLRVAQPGKPTFICQVEAGQLARHGANSAGIALNANGLGAGFGRGLGVPGSAVRRKVLESWDLHEALKVIFDARQSLSSNLLLTHRDGFAIDVETTPGRHGWMYPTEGLLVHGNHFQAFVPPQIENSYRPFSVDSLYRVPRVESGLARLRSDGTTDDAVRTVVRDTMTDHFGHPDAVCQHADPRRHELDRCITVVSSLVDLTTGTYHLTQGVPCTNSYQQIPWNLYDGPGPEDRPDVPAPASSFAGIS